MQAFILVNIAGENPVYVAKELLRIDIIDNTHVVYGDCDIIAHADSKDLVQLRECVLNEVLKLKGVKRASTLIVAE